jgi:hypothetical protein
MFRMPSGWRLFFHVRTRLMRAALLKRRQDRRTPKAMWCRSLQLLH